MSSQAVLAALATAGIWVLFPAAFSTTLALIGPRKVALRRSVAVATLMVLLVAPIVFWISPSDSGVLHLRRPAHDTSGPSLRLGTESIDQPEMSKQPDSGITQTSNPVVRGSGRTLRSTARIIGPRGSDSSTWSIIARVATAAWIIGVGLVSLYFLVGHTRMNGICRRARPAERYGTGFAPIRITKEMRSPCTYGLFRPVILIPAEFMKRAQARTIRAIILHEAEHVRNRDQWLQLLTQIAVALFWWHPVSWIMRYEGLRLSEYLADAGASGRLSANAYLVEMARALLLSDQLPAPNVASGAISVAGRRLQVLEAGVVIESRGLQRSVTIAVLAVVMMGVGAFPLFASGAGERPVEIPLLVLPENASVEQYVRAAEASRVEIPAAPNQDVEFERVELDVIADAGSDEPRYAARLFDESDTLLAEISYSRSVIHSATFYTTVADETWGFVTDRNGDVARVTRRLSLGTSESAELTYLPDGSPNGAIKRITIDPASGETTTRLFRAPNRLQRRVVETASGSTMFNGAGDVTSTSHIQTDGTVVVVDLRGEVRQTTTTTNAATAEFLETLTDALISEQIMRLSRGISALAMSGRINLFGEAHGGGYLLSRGRYDPPSTVSGKAHGWITIP